MHYNMVIMFKITLLKSGCCTCYLAITFSYTFSLKISKRSYIFYNYLALKLFLISHSQVQDPSQPNDEGITALHNAVCAGHTEIVKFLVQFGVNVNAADSDGW